MAFVVGLDIGTRSLKGAVFAGSSRKYRLVDFFVEDIPSMENTQVAFGGNGGAESAEIEAPPSPEEIIQKALEERRLSNADIYTALDAKDCGIRDVPFPYTREDQIQKTVAFEAEHFFHAFDVDDVTLEWVKVGEADGMSHLVLVAARNEEIEKRLDLLKRAGIDPVAIDLDSAALANAFSLSPHYDETRNTLLVDMGATSTKIVLLEGGKLKKIRSLRTGATTLDPGRMIAEPEVAGSDSGGDGSGVMAADSSVELRLQEIENALSGLQPARGEVDLSAAASMVEAPPIAILADDDYARVEGAEVEEAGAVATEAEPGETESAVAESAATQGLEVEPAEAGLPESELPPSGLAAERFTDREATGERDEDAAYREYLDRVGVEIQRTLATTQLETPIELICLTGGMSRHEDAQSFFQDSFGIDTVRLDFREGLETDLGADGLALVGSEGAVAVGLAAKGMGQDLVGFDFRKGPYRFEHRLERMRLPLLVCAILCFLVFLQTAFWSFHRYRELRDHAVAYERGAEQVYKTFFEKEVTKGRNPLAAAREQKKRWEAGGLSNVGRFLPYVDVVRDVSSVMASTELFFKLNNIKYNLRLQRKVTGSGRNKKTRWASAGDSQIVLEAEESDGWLTIEKAFNRTPRSKFFEASSRSSPQPNGAFKVSVSLKVREDALNPPAKKTGIRS